MTSIPQFDSHLGGDTEVPIEVDTMKFVTARAQEIAAISQELEDESQKGKLIFQRLPRHMRRRVMGHNAKRMPRNQREAHTQQLLKSSRGTVTKHKRPSRKHRRRPSHLLDEYNRRQRKFVWLETHIWHAKRFHMTECWGYRLALFPNDRSYRACYRAAANHCLLQDISFFCCIELVGPLDVLLTGLSKHTDTNVGLTFAAQSLIDGSREGELMFYESNKYPWQPIGTVFFFWKPDSPSSVLNERNLWIWAHPAFHQRIVDALSTTFRLDQLSATATIPNADIGKQENGAVNFPLEKITSTEKRESDNQNTPTRKKIKTEDGKPKNVEEEKLKLRNVPFERAPKFRSKCGLVQMVLLKDTLNRFRLTGPLSQAILEEALQLTNDSDGNFFSNNTSVPSMDFSSEVNEEIISQTESCLIDSDIQGRQAHHKFWLSNKGRVSPAELPPKIVLALTVKDPRLQIPDKRTKAIPTPTETKIDGTLGPPPTYASPLWASNIRDVVTNCKLSTAEINTLRSKFLVPGILRTADQNVDSGESRSKLEASVNSKIPLILVQRPGSQDPLTKRLGFGCGWDVILPAGWAMPFWLAFIFRCARPSGLREASSHELEKGQCEFLPPDSNAGEEEMLRKGRELRDIYFRLPPNKRPNFIKLGTACPFQCDWSNLIRDWILSAKEGTLDAVQSQQLKGTDPSFFVLRDRKVLQAINHFLSDIWSILQQKSLGASGKLLTENVESKLPTFPNGIFSLLPVRVEALQKGVTDDMSLICLPLPEDVANILAGKEPVELPCHDKNQERRQLSRTEHKKLLLRLRRQRVRAKKRQEEENSENPEQNHSNSTSPATQELVASQNKKMEDLWLRDTSIVGSIKNSCSRETAGFVTRGNFSFTEAKGCGVGYITYLSLLKLMQVWVKDYPNEGPSKLKSASVIVLVRSPNSFQYRLAKLSLAGI